MKRNNRLSRILDFTYNALLIVLTVSFILALASFVIYMPSGLMHIIHAIVFTGLCLAVPAGIIILYHYHIFIKRRTFFS